LLGVEDAIIVGSGVTVGVGARVGLGVPVGNGVSTGSGSGLGPIDGVGAAAVGVGVAPGVLTLVGAAAFGAAGCLSRRDSITAGSTIIVALELLDGAFEALIVILFVHGPGLVAVKVTSITVNAFGASDPILASAKPPGDRHPPATTSVSTILLAVAFPRFPYPIENVMLEPTMTWSVFASLITTRSAA
jgi:hypothetical protein